MLAHLESRFADVLGSRLPAPLTGRVFVTPGPVATTQPALLVGVVRAVVVEQSFGGVRRPEQVPGADDPRRVVRLRCTIRVEVRPGDNSTRAETVAALDAVLYEVDGPELRTASALSAPGDPGFVLRGQQPSAVLLIPEPPDDARLPAVELETEGWFWPPNTPGITGMPIVAALVRTATLPVALQPWPLLLRAGDPPVPLTIRVGTAGTTRLSGDPPAPSPFGELAVRVVDTGGRPGSGTLTGGTALPDGSRLLTVTEQVAALTYQPPASPADDELVVSVGRADAGAGPGVGIELTRFPLTVTT